MSQDAGAVQGRCRRKFKEELRKNDSQHFLLKSRRRRGKMLGQLQAAVERRKSKDVEKSQGFEAALARLAGHEDKISEIP